MTVAVIVGLLVAACGPTESPSASEEVLGGGTLRVALVQSGTEPVPGAPYYDPAESFLFSPLWRCCLLRTLLSYSGRSTEDGGAELRADLATDLPDVSADGLTWTFHLQPGIHYAPPLADRVIEARDIVTAFEHAFRFGDPLPVPIVGIAAFAEGSVDTIAGLEASDDTTLVVHLDEPMGDFGFYMATSQTAPIPEEAIAGREDGAYAGYLVASGPYMYEGAAAIDVTDPTADPIWVARGGQSLALVRNPSWDRSTDSVRGAYVDRIEVTLAPTPEAAAALVEDGLADVTGEPSPVEVVERFLADPDLQERGFTQNAPRVQYLAMNLAAPPFDDLHVRRAVNFVIDRASVADAMQEERGIGFEVAHHAIPDILLNNLLTNYAPFATSSDRGDLRAAQEEVRASDYDADGDGVCDAEACAAVAAAYINETPRTHDLIAQSLAEIGIHLVATDADPFDPAAHVAATVGIGWGVDLPRATNFAGLLRGTGLTGGNPNLSLLGARPEELEAWGYDVATVPSLDPFVDACESAAGNEVFECWATIDQLVMERVVAWAPLAFAINGWITSERVASFAADVHSIGPSLDRIQVRAEP